MLTWAEVNKVVCYMLNRMHIHAVDKSIDSPYTLAILLRGYLRRSHNCSGHELGNASILWKPAASLRRTGTYAVLALCS